MKRLRGAIPAHILQRVTTLRLLDDALRECIPRQCHGHYRAAGLSGGTLLLLADSPAWRTRLRFHSTQIINHVTELGKFPVTRVKIRVSSALEAPPRNAGGGQPRTIPAASARAFGSLARETEDDALRGALERLARHGRPESPPRGDD